MGVIFTIFMYILFFSVLSGLYTLGGSLLGFIVLLIILYCLWVVFRCFLAGIIMLGFGILGLNFQFIIRAIALMGTVTAVTICVGYCILSTEYGQNLKEGVLLKKAID